MFTWICPQCGREVPPSYNDCPDCAAKTAAAAPPLPAAAPPPPLESAPPPPAAFRPEPPPPAAYEPSHAQSPLFAAAPPPPPPPKQRAGAILPTWALAALFALAFLGVGLGVYAIATRNHGIERQSANSRLCEEAVDVNDHVGVVGGV